PVDLLRLPRAERLGKLHRGEPRACHYQHAGSISVQAVHEARLFALPAAPGFQHAVHMAVDAGAALHRKACRLIEDENLLVLMDQHLREHLGIAMVAYGAYGGWR